MNLSSPIGIFDSGVGGLTVLKECVNILPKEKFIYFGDIKRAPYGDKEKDTIVRYAKEITAFMLTKGVKAIVVACNTESAYALDELKKITDIPIIGVIEPAVIAADKVSITKKIAVIATKATVNSKAYSETSRKIYNYDIKEIACPSLVPIIEKGIYNENDIQKALNEDVKLDDKLDIDTLILGCTHYPIIKEYIKKYFNVDNIVNPAMDTARNLYNDLKYRNLLAINNKHEIAIYSSMVTDTLKKVALDIDKNIKFHTLEFE